MNRSVDTHFFNIADSYLAWHKQNEPEMQAIMDTLRDTPDDAKNGEWAGDIDSITEIIEAARNLTLAVQKVIIRKSERHK